MSGVNNKTARQYNIRALDSKTGNCVTVRIAPGFNTVAKEHWDVVSKDPYVKQLKADNKIEFGKEQDDEEELGKEADTKNKSKSVPLPPKSESK